MTQASGNFGDVLARAGVAQQAPPERVHELDAPRPVREHRQACRRGATYGGWTKRFQAWRRLDPTRQPEPVPRSWPPCRWMRRDSVSRVKFRGLYGSLIEYVPARAAVRPERRRPAVRDHEVAAASRG